MTFIIKDVCKLRNLKLMNLSHLNETSLYNLTEKLSQKTGILAVYEYYIPFEKNTFINHLLKSADIELMEDYIIIFHRNHISCLSVSGITLLTIDSLLDTYNESDGKSQICNICQCNKSLLQSCYLCAKQICRDCISNILLHSKNNLCPYCKTGNFN